MVLLQTPICDFGQPAVDFSLPNIDGSVLTLDDCRGERGTLVMFICNHCPYVKAIIDHLIHDCRELHTHEIKTVAIMSNDSTGYPEDSPENMQQLALSKNFPFPYLLDKTQEIAKAYGAVCTPDFFGYNSSLELQYRGRFNAAGREPSDAVMDRDLYNAMVQIAETGKGSREQIPSMGCSIKWITD